MSTVVRNITLKDIKNNSQQAMAKKKIEVINFNELQGVIPMGSPKKLCRVVIQLAKTYPQLVPSLKHCNTCNASDFEFNLIWEQITTVYRSMWYRI